MKSLIIIWLITLIVIIATMCYIFELFVSFKPLPVNGGTVTTLQYTPVTPVDPQSTVKGIQ
jgi:hypothetical protein